MNKYLRDGKLVTQSPHLIIKGTVDFVLRAELCFKI